MKEKLRNFSKKLGLASLAVLWCLADRGKMLLEELLDNKRNLRKSMARIDAAKDVNDYYDILRGIKENNMRTIIWRLKNKGLVEKNGDAYISTKLGATLVESLRENYKKVNWDGKWRLILFDIPERRRGQRLWLNARLIKMNYKPLQKSVFIGKLPLDEDFIEELLERNLYQYVRVITVGEIDDEKYLV